jgi:hypothetical protein
MKSSLFRVKSLAVLAVAGLTVLSSGCTLLCRFGKLGSPKAYNLKVTLGSSLKDSSVVVDVIPANPSDLERLKTYSINKYWKSGDPLRQDLTKTTFSFVSGDKLEQTLPAKDPKWKEWKKAGVQYLVVIADLPGLFEEGKTGSQDPRRQLIPICRCYWVSGTKDLKVEVQTSGVRPAVAPRVGHTLPPGW